MNARNFLNKTVALKINQPLGSKHPIGNFFYPINYGSLINGSKKLSAYVLGIYEPIEVFEGTCIAILHHPSDKKDILIIVPNGKNYTNAQINALTEFQEKFFEHTIIR